MIPISPGDTFGRLTVVARDGKTHRGAWRYRCQCECGTEKRVNADALRHGRTRSCGCLRRELSAIYRKAGVSGPLKPGVTRPDFRDVGDTATGFPVGRPRDDDKPRTERFPFEPVDWPVRSKLVFRCLRRGSMTRREIADRTLLTGDAVAEALEHLGRIGETVEVKTDRGYVYSLSLETLVNL